MVLQNGSQSMFGALFGGMIPDFKWKVSCCLQQLVCARRALQEGVCRLGNACIDDDHGLATPWHGAGHLRNNKALISRGLQEAGRCTDGFCFGS